MADFKHLVRVANTDLKGEKQVVYALKDVRGLGVPLAFALCKALKIDENKNIGDLSDSDVQKINAAIQKMPDSIPKWMLNRQSDYDTGENKHLVGNDLIFAKDNDVKRMKRIKCYKGVRHTLRQPVRGQRTRSHFRENKGKVMGVKTSGKKAGAA